ncbi:protein RALF-like 11 [Raphanus sativus]|uniref:Protein RALF-like 11 n=1 Tax=Raphanus sativus TaxID=3726 RepID=A0A6J0L6J1_RAPSA|nr:protein RALF-like 11 [Raphanus sativus]
MKTWAICLLVICSLVVTVPVEGRTYIFGGVVNPCSGPNPPPGCNPPDSLHKSRVPANNYTRGCSIITRCQRD